ncbi:unnamed protein product [Sordaria macrospora k-hell]|uniref:WGS project CABT00000000 data, contig 2.3 n=1 Tax=Sordaria macrospora (strain ATCC MYA-333 / DSM 997 / K(L3346) / K-hell) TaxID=771870 RepID=F7VPN8_SORMK|nr:uncharacterized protein SMAC_02470 [Sordaria macrospora k-hell]CCC07466.1 unnamed protein product [Sordaria macrospora k-hell]
MSVRPPVAETIFDLIVFVVSLVNISNNNRQLDLIGAPNYVEPLYLIYRLLSACFKPGGAAAVLLVVGTILITICQYGIPNTGSWLVKAMEIIFWIYLALSFVISAFLYLLLWSTTVFPIHTMTPVWVFPAYPLLLTAPYGANLIAASVKAGHTDEIKPISIALASVAVQGTGFLISFMICAAFLYRLMTQKLPRDYQRPGVFISIGPGAFTAAGLVQLANSAPDFVPADFLGTQGGVAISILRILAYMAGIWLWGLSCWFFLVSVGSLWKYLRPEGKSKLQFQMTWFSFVFPNTALVTATEQLGKAFESDGLKILGCVLTGCIILRQRQRQWHIFAPAQPPTFSASISVIVVIDTIVLVIHILNEKHEEYKYKKYDKKLRPEQVIQGVKARKLGSSLDILEGLSYLLSY